MLTFRIQNQAILALFWKVLEQSNRENFVGKKRKKAPGTKKPSVYSDAEKPIEQQKETEDTPKLFSIHCGQPNPNNAVIDVTWCLQSETTDYLLKEKIRYPHMLVSVFRREEIKLQGYPSEYRIVDYHRYLETLETGMVQIQFSKPGTYLICASVVWINSVVERMAGKNKATETLLELYLKLNHSGRFERYLSTDQAYAPSALLGGHHLYHHEQAEIMVRDFFFAKEPPTWLSWYVNFGHEKKPVDQCQFRRRFLFEFLPKIPLPFIYFTLALSARILCLVLAWIMGWRKINYKAFQHYIDWTALSIFNEFDEEKPRKSFWWLTDTQGKRRPWLASALMAPAVWFLAILSSPLGNLIWGTEAEENLNQTTEIWPFLAWSLCFMGGYFVALLIGKFIYSSVIPAIKETFKNFFEARSKKHEIKKRQAEKAEEIEIQKQLEQFYAINIEPLVCDQGGPKAGSVKALPQSHQKLYLRFLDFKAQVCKPFMRG